MERIYCDQWTNDDQIEAVTRVPDGPEKLLLGLERFPGVSVRKLSVLESNYADLQTTFKQMRQDLECYPLTAVFCNAGLYRSRVIANALALDDLVLLSTCHATTEDDDEFAGCGHWYIDNYGMGFNEDGVFIYPDKIPLDSLVLNFSLEKYRYGDRRTMTQVGLILEQGLPLVTKRKDPFSIIWLEGKEDDYLKWFPEN